MIHVLLELFSFLWTGCVTWMMQFVYSANNDVKEDHIHINVRVLFLNTGIMSDDKKREIPVSPVSR